VLIFYAAPAAYQWALSWGNSPATSSFW